MLLLTVVITAAGGLLACGGQSPSSLRNWPGRDGPIVVLGDSLVAGTGAAKGEDFPSVMEALMGREVLNLGVPGATSGDLAPRVASALEPSPKLVILAIGGNDLLNQIPSEATVANINATVEALTAGGAMVAIVGYRFGPGKWDLRKQCRQIAEQSGAWYLDNPLKEIYSDSKYKSDRAHMNAAGYRIMAERIAEGVRPVLEDL